MVSMGNHQTRSSIDQGGVQGGLDMIMTMMTAAIGAKIYHARRLCNSIELLEHEAVSCVLLQPTQIANGRGSHTNIARISKS